MDLQADIGISKGVIVDIGKAGNPDVMANVSPKLIVGSSTEVIAGEKLIVTAGGIDAHVHYICPQQWPEALASGVTTMIGGGTGPSAGTSATTCTPSPFYMQHMLAATDGIPMNFAFTGKVRSFGTLFSLRMILVLMHNLVRNVRWFREMTPESRH